MTRRALIAAAISLVACSADRPTLDVVLDLPPTDSAAYPFGTDVVDQLRIAVARAGDSTDIQSVTAGPDDDLGLRDVPFGTDLVIHLYGELDGTEVAYGRSCTFTVDSDNGPGELHLYFSRLVRWGVGPTPILPGRIGGQSFARASGDIVIAGGEQEAPLEQFLPRSGIFAEVSDTSIAARSGGKLATLGSDRAVLVGGTAGGEPVTSVQTLPDPRDSVADGLPLRRHAVASLVGDRVLVAGGELWGGSAFAVTDRAWEVRSGAGGAIELVEVPPMASPRAGHTLTRLSDETGAGVLVAGGQDGAGQPVAATEIYRPLAGTFEPLPGTLERWDHQAIRLPGGFVLIVGGFAPDPNGGDPIPATELLLFDPVQGTFATAGELPEGAGIVGFSATPLPDGRVLLAGGRDAAGELVDAALIARLDPIDGRVDISPTDPLSMPRADHVAQLACDGTVLVVGGETAAGAPPSERYNPPPDARR